MARKGRRDIRVFGCTLLSGEELRAGDNGMVSIIVHGDKTVSTIDSHNTTKVIEGAVWVSYTPRTL